MIREVLSSIDGIAMYPVIALLLFMIIFAVSVYRVMKMDRGIVNRMGQLPLESDETINDFKGNKNE